MIHLFITEELDLAQEEWQASVDEWRSRYFPQWKEEFNQYKRDV